MTMIFIKRIILLLPKEVVNVVDLGYLGIEKDFPEQISSLPNKKKRNHEIIHKKQKEYNENMLKRGV